MLACEKLTKSLIRIVAICGGNFNVLEFYVDTLAYIQCHQPLIFPKKKPLELFDINEMSNVS